MISRKLAGATAAGVGAATAVVALLLGTVSGSAADEPTASAYGIAATGLVPISPTPQVVAPPDGEAALLELPSPLGVGVLKVKAAGHTSSATAVDLDILELIEARIIEATCDNGVGNVSILGGTIAGSQLPSNPATGQNLDLSPIASVVFNRQTANQDGTLTVDALVISVLPGGQAGTPITPGDLDRLRGLVPDLNVPGIEQLQPGQSTTAQPGVPTIEDLVAKLRELNPTLPIPSPGQGGPLLEVVISSATCGAAKVTPSPAPKPEPVETKLPVTH